MYPLDAASEETESSLECGGLMLELQCGDRIEFFYEDTPGEEAAAAAMCATFARLLSDQEEGMGVEVEDYAALWIEITVDQPCEMETKQVVLFGTDFKYRINGRPVKIRKKHD